MYKYFITTIVEFDVDVSVWCDVKVTKSMPITEKCLFKYTTYVRAHGQNFPHPLNLANRCFLGSY